MNTKLQWMEQILGFTSRILQKVDLVFLRLYILSWSFVSYCLVFGLTLLKKAIMCDSLFLFSRNCIEQLDAVVKELYNRSNKWPLVVLHKKRIRTLLENLSNREVLEEWIAQGVVYGTPYGSNDDW